MNAVYSSLVHRCIYIVLETTVGKGTRTAQQEVLTLLSGFPDREVARNHAACVFSRISSAQIGSRVVRVGGRDFYGRRGALIDQR